MLQSQTNSGVAKISLLLLTYFIKYIAYSALTFAIGTVLAIILVILLTISGDNLSFKFLQYFSFINPALNQQSFSLDLNDVMRLYFFITLVLFVVIEIIKYILNKIFKWKIAIKFNKKLLINAAIITAIYIIAVLILPWMKVADGQEMGFYLLFLFYYFISLTSSTIYFSLNKINELLYQIISKI